MQAFSQCKMEKYSEQFGHHSDTPLPTVQHCIVLSVSKSRLLFNLYSSLLTFQNLYSDVKFPLIDFELETYEEENVKTVEESFTVKEEDILVMARYWRGKSPFSFCRYLCSYFDFFLNYLQIHTLIFLKRDTDTKITTARTPFIVNDF